MKSLNYYANYEFQMNYSQLGEGEKEWCRDEQENDEYKLNKK